MAQLQLANSQEIFGSNRKLAYSSVTCRKGVDLTGGSSADIARQALHWALLLTQDALPLVSRDAASMAIAPCCSAATARSLLALLESRDCVPAACLILARTAAPIAASRPCTCRRVSKMI